MRASASARWSLKAGSSPRSADGAPVTGIALLGCPSTGRAHAGAGRRSARDGRRTPARCAGGRRRRGRPPRRATPRPAPRRSIHGALMKTARSGSSPSPLTTQICLEAVELPPEGIATRLDVDQAEVVAVRAGSGRRRSPAAAARCRRSRAAAARARRRRCPWRSSCSRRPGAPAPEGRRAAAGA